MVVVVLVVVVVLDFIVKGCTSRGCMSRDGINILAGSGPGSSVAAAPRRGAAPSHGPGPDPDPGPDPVPAVVEKLVFPMVFSVMMPKIMFLIAFSVH